MIPFANSWPYDRLGDDLYVQTCPFCEASNVLLPLKKDDLLEIQTGVKRLLIFPCCRNRVTVVDADSDYFLASRKLRKL